MRSKGLYIVLVIVAVAAVLAGGCRKTKVLATGGQLRFSEDTLHFDTVFTAAGSFTSFMKIYNPQNETVELSSVRLENGGASLFHLNVNGFEGNNVPNLKIPPHDSIYVFATVKIDPSDTLTPFLVTDRLIATMNGQEFSVPFTAYGQNAHYIVSDSISTNVTWLTDKPYVVLHACVVGYTGKLTIPANCRVYMHQDARFFVYGELSVNPTGKDSVVFQGDRLDRAYFGYEGYPGEWGGIYVVPGGLAKIKNAVIKNCGGSTPYHGYGIQPAAIEVDTAGLLVIDHSRIENSIGYGVLSLQGNVHMSNCLVNSTGAQALAVIRGGYDSIVNCTFGNYGGTGLSHANNTTVGILNYFNNGDGTWVPGDLDAVLRNCIIYGSLDSEVIYDSLGGATARLRMDHCILKAGKIRPGFVQFTDCIFNEDPKFANEQAKDYHLLDGSPAIGKGIAIPNLGKDLDGKTWGVPPDVGCYKFN